MHLTGDMEVAHSKNYTGPLLGDLVEIYRDVIIFDSCEYITVVFFSISCGPLFTRGCENGDTICPSFV
jgi:hypothetical protein